MRKVVSTTTIKRVQRNGVTYEFGRDVEPGFYSSFPHRTYYPTLTTLWARKHNGYEWVNLHHFTVESE